MTRKDLLINIVRLNILIYVFLTTFTKNELYNKMSFMAACKPLTANLDLVLTVKTVQQ